MKTFIEKQFKAIDIEFIIARLLDPSMTGTLSRMSAVAFLKQAIDDATDVGQKEAGREGAACWQLAALLPRLNNSPATDRQKEDLRIYIASMQPSTVAQMCDRMLSPFELEKRGKTVDKLSEYLTAEESKAIENGSGRNRREGGSSFDNTMSKLETQEASMSFSEDRPPSGPTPYIKKLNDDVDRMLGYPVRR